MTLAKHRRRRSRRANRKQQPVEFRIEVGGRGSLKRKLEVALEELESGNLKRLEVIHWRNPDVKQGRSRNWQSGPSGRVLSESSSGFKTALIAAIEENLRKI